MRRSDDYLFAIEELLEQAGVAALIARWQPNAEGDAWTVIGFATIEAAVTSVDALAGLQNAVAPLGDRAETTEARVEPDNAAPLSEAEIAIFDTSRWMVAVASISPAERLCVGVLLEADASSGRRAAAWRGIVRTASSLLSGHGTPAKAGEASRPDWAALSALDCLSVPLLILEPDGTLDRLNRAAADHLRTDDRLRVQGNRLVARNSAVDMQLREAVRWCALAPTARPAVIACPDDETGKLGPFCLACAPMRDRSDRVVVTIHVSRTDPIMLDLTLQAMGLTRAERGLAARLVRGETLENAALAMNIKLETARGYLKRIFGKLGVRRQSEMIRMVQAMTPLMLPDGRVATRPIPRPSGRTAKASAA